MTSRWHPNGGVQNHALHRVGSKVMWSRPSVSLLVCLFVYQLDHLKSYEQILQLQQIQSLHYYYYYYYNNNY